MASPGNFYWEPRCSRALTFNENLARASSCAHLGCSHANSDKNSRPWRKCSFRVGEMIPWEISGSNKHHNQKNIAFRVHGTLHFSVAGFLHGGAGGSSPHGLPHLLPKVVVSRRPNANILKKVTSRAGETRVVFSNCRIT